MLTIDGLPTSQSDGQFFERGSSGRRSHQHNDRKNNNNKHRRGCLSGLVVVVRKASESSTANLSKGLLVSFPAMCPQGGEVGEEGASRTYGSSDPWTGSACDNKASKAWPEQSWVAAEVCWKQESTPQHISPSLSPLTEFFPLNASSIS